MRDTHRLEIQREVQLRIQKGSEQARVTYSLNIMERGTSQDTENTKANKVHSLPGKHQGKYELGHRIKMGKQKALTNWKHRGGNVRTLKEREQVREALASWRVQERGSIST